MGNEKNAKIRLFPIDGISTEGFDKSNILKHVSTLLSIDPGMITVFKSYKDSVVH